MKHGQPLGLRALPPTGSVLPVLQESVEDRPADRPLLRAVGGHASSCTAVAVASSNPANTLSAASVDAVSCPSIASRTSPPGVLRRLLLEADIRVDGSRPWDLRVHDDRVFRRLLLQGSLGFGESYLDGDWDCERLDQFFDRVLTHRLDERTGGWARLKLALGLLLQARSNPQSPRKAFVVGEHHYDLGNDLFEAMLDPRMTYSCGYWAQARTLEQAQEHKLEMVCRKLQLQPGQSLLEIGCGWGGLARYAAEHFGVRVVGLTVSREQQAAAREACAGWPVDIRLQDYREIQGRFDRVVSVGMFEHVGPRNHAAYFDTVHRVLAPEGLFLLHTIGLDRPGRWTDPWIEKYIFPGGQLPDAGTLAAQAQQRFVIEDWHNFGPDYDHTLMHWHANVEGAWPRLQARYGERFRRMWRYYLLSCAGFFRSRQGQLWQLVLTHRERRAPYRSVRPSLATAGPSGGLSIG